MNTPIFYDDDVARQLIQLWLQEALVTPTPQLPVLHTIPLLPNTLTLRSFPGDNILNSSLLDSDGFKYYSAKMCGPWVLLEKGNASQPFGLLGYDIDNICFEVKGPDGP